MRQTKFYSCLAAVFVTTLTTGCSTLETRPVLISIDSDNWQRDDVARKPGKTTETIPLASACFSNYAIEKRRSHYQCGDTTISVDEIELGKLALFGPPFVPLMPVALSRENSLTVKFHQSYETGNLKVIDYCPASIVTYTNNLELIETEEIVSDGQSEGKCVYRFDDKAEKYDQLNIRFKLRNPGCETEPLYFEYYMRRDYCVFGFPTG